MSDWQLVATHGDPDAEEKIRAAVLDQVDAALMELRRQLEQDGFPAWLIDAALAQARALAAAHTESRLPLVLRDLAITAGAARMH